MNLSARLTRFSEPETLKMAKLGRALREQGHDITDLSLGEPDFNTPEHIKEAVVKAVNDNYSHYTPVSGYLDVREAACHKFKRDNNLTYKAENIVISTGAKQSITNCVFATTDAGDEVVIPTPYWVSYSEIVRLGGATPILVRTTPENKFKITPAELEDALTERTRLFMFSSPNNPTGSVYTKEELQALAQVFLKYPNVYIMSDEIYEHISYVGNVYSIAEIPEMFERTIIINGLSKAYAMTGYRLGIMAANANVAKACDKIQGQFTSGTNAATQRAAIGCRVYKA
jgi:aspartate aminotransferase